METPHNPYIAGNPVGNSASFVGREDILNEVVRDFREPSQNAFVLHGQRRIGKTSILQQLKVRLSRHGKFLPIYYDLQDKTEWPTEHVLQDLANALSEALNLPEPDLGSDPQKKFGSSWLPNNLKRLPENHAYVLLFDEFENLTLPQVDRAANSFFPYLRNLIEIDRARLKFVFAIGRNVEDFDNIALSLLKNATFRSVSLLSEEKTELLVRLSELNNSLFWTQDAVKHVYQMTSGHPYLTQQLCYQTWERAHGKGPTTTLPRVTVEQVEDAVPDALEASHSALEWIWKGLGPAERIVTSALSSAGLGPIRQESLEEILHENGIKPFIGTIQKSPRLLEKWGLIKPSKEGYRFCVELLRQWVFEHKPIGRVQEELDSIDPAADHLYQLAKVYYELKHDVGAATEFLNRALALNPNHVAANQLLAEILLTNGNVEEARQLMEQLYINQPGAARQLLLRIEFTLLRTAQSEEDKLAIYERVLEVAPSDLNAISGKRQILAKRKSRILQSSDPLSVFLEYQEAQIKELILSIDNFYENARLMQRKEFLSWEAVREAVQQVSAEQMDKAQRKYDRALYLQREPILKKFQDFLSSDKTCFVLTGKSGVGKTSFILSLAAEFSGYEDMTFLTFDTARFTIANTVEHTIGQNLAKSILLRDLEQEEIFAELERSAEMQNRKLVVIFDAINENSNPRELLRKIDQMVGRERYSWLKVLITSRPEGWRTMKRGLPLAEERYYKEKGSEDVSIELEEFTIKLDIFERDELQSVYEKYCRFFNLKTAYSALELTVRNALRDPLVLRLIADIYRNNFIPDHIQVNDIYKSYVDSLISTGRLYREDIIFLEQELMPLMLKQGFYENKLTASQIQPAKTRDGRPLWELIYNADSIGGGQRVNASYVRLRDAELLDETGEGMDYVIAFKYSRFYEFFGGRRLYQAAREQLSLLDFYGDVAKQLNIKVFLWGAMVQALALELNDGNLSLVKGLAEQTSDNRLLRAALVEALVRFGEGNRRHAETFVLELIGQLTPPPRNVFAELARLLQPAREDALQAQSQKMIVLEAAMRLRLTDLLENLAVEPSAWLRNLAVQNIFYLWKQDHQAGIKILDSLGYRVRGRFGLPDLGAVESLLALIGAILGFERKDPSTLESLSTIGRRALRRVLYLTDLNKKPTFFNGIRKGLLGVAYNLVTGVVLKFALRIIGDWGEHAWSSRAGMEHFFRLPPEQKSLVKTMIPYLDFEETGFETRVPDMIKIEDWGDQISQTVIEFSLLSHGVQDFDKTLEIARQMVEYSLSFKPPSFWVSGLLRNLWQSAAHLENPNPDFLSLMEKVTKAIQDDPALWLEQAKRQRPVPLASDSRAANIGNHIGAHYVFTKRVEIPTVILTYIEQAMLARDDEYIKAYIREFVSIFEMGYHHIAIAGLKSVANYKDEYVQHAVIDFLVRAKNYDPEYVEDLLMLGEFPQEIGDRVLANPTSERLADLLTYQLLNIIYDLFILGPKMLRNESKWLLSKGLELHNFEEFVVLIIREMFNLVVGEVVFSVPLDAPSRHMRIQ